MHNNYYILDNFNRQPSILYFEKIDSIKLDIVQHL